MLYKDKRKEKDGKISVAYSMPTNWLSVFIRGGPIYTSISTDPSGFKEINGDVLVRLLGVDTGADFIFIRISRMTRYQSLLSLKHFRKCSSKDTVSLKLLVSFLLNTVCG